MPFHHLACYGQGANSQLGPVRPTYVPSGQSLASRVQAFELGVGLPGLMVPEKIRGNLNDFAFAGSPLGLSFSRIRKPDAAVVLKVRVAVKLTGLPLSQLPGTFSLACP